MVDNYDIFTGNIIINKKGIGSNGFYNRLVS